MQGTNAQRVFRLMNNLIAQPNYLPFYLKNSVFSKKEPLELELPWISLAAINFLRGYLNNKHEVLELGGGGSTIFFAKYAKSVHCLESYEEWTNKIMAKIEKLSLKNAIIKTLPYDITSEKKFLSSEYFREITQNKFDVILVDNYEDSIPLRPACFYAAEKSINPGGIIVLDDSWRYTDIRKKNSAKKYKIFKSVGPSRYGVTSTDIYFY